LSNLKKLKEQLWTIVEDNSTAKGKAFDYTIQVLIFLSVISFSLETLPNLSEEAFRLLHIFDACCIAVFTIEYILRVFVAKNRMKYIFSFYGIVDLLAILPFYLKTFVDLRALRIFRVFKVFRSLQLTRYNRAIKRFKIAMKIAKEEIVLFLLATGILIYLTAAGIYFFEHNKQPEAFSSVVDSAWWAVVTLTTVGYGDVYPITTGGRIFTFFILIIGVAIVTVPAGLIATALSKAREIEEEV
jgi:voltage-gated potassium channel